jgi:hypothetical protein
MYQYFQNNPTGRTVGDCAVRAVSVALDIPWEEAYAMIAANGFAMGDLPSSNSVWGATLRMYGYKRRSIPDTCPDCYTFEDFAKDNPKGTFVLCTGTHVATIRDGIIYDAWDSRSESPQFVWYKEE